MHPNAKYEKNFFSFKKYLLYLQLEDVLMSYNGQVYEPCLFGTIKLTTAFNKHGLYTML